MLTTRAPSRRSVRPRCGHATRPIHVAVPSGFAPHVSARCPFYSHSTAANGDAAVSEALRVSTPSRIRFRARRRAPQVKCEVSAQSACALRLNGWVRFEHLAAPHAHTPAGLAWSAWPYTYTHRLGSRRAPSRAKRSRKATGMEGVRVTRINLERGRKGSTRGSQARRRSSSPS